MKLTKKELMRLEKDALVKWGEASNELKKAMDYMDGEVSTEEVRNPLTGEYPVDDEFMQTVHSCWAVYEKCTLAQKRYWELVEANDIM